MLGQHKAISPTYGGRVREIRTSGTAILLLQTTWDTLAEAKAGAELAAGLLVVDGKCLAASSRARVGGE